MEKYKNLIDKTLATLAEVASLTENTIDDTVVSGVRLLFERYFGTGRVFGVPANAAALDAAVYGTDTGLPLWAVPIIAAILRALLGL